MGPIGLIIGVVFVAATVTTSELAIEDTNLSSLLTRQAVPYSQEVFSHALSIIDKLDGAASCHRLATAKVISSCRSVDSTLSDQARILDQIKSVYAARLALCELSDAHVTIPKECKHMAPPNESPRSDHKKNRACLRSLESRSQWWTSYSNARQNGVIICQAARSEIDKDEALRTHRTLVKNVADMTASLSEHMGDSDARLREQKRFFQVASRLEKEFLNNIHHSHNNLQTSVANIASRVEKRLQGFLSAIFQGFDAIAQSVQKLDNSMDQSAQHAIALQTSVDDLEQNHISALTAVVQDIHNELQASSTLLGLMHSRQYFLDERMNVIVQSFKDLEMSAKHIAETQIRLAGQQMQLFANLQTKTNDTTFSLENVEARMNELASTINEKTVAAQSIQFPGKFTMLIVKYLGWTIRRLMEMRVLIGSILAIMLSRLTKRPLWLCLSVEAFVFVSVDITLTVIGPFGSVLVDPGVYYEMCFGISIALLIATKPFFPMRDASLNRNTLFTNFNHADVIDF